MKLSSILCLYNIKLDKLVSCTSRLVCPFSASVHGLQIDKYGTVDAICALCRWQSSIDILTMVGCFMIYPPICIPFIYFSAHFLHCFTCLVSLWLSHCFQPPSDIRFSFNLERWTDRFLSNALQVLCTVLCVSLIVLYLKSHWATGIFYQPANNLRHDYDRRDIMSRCYESLNA
jgi:hypothetical protein